MSHEYRHFTVTVPAGTTIAAPQVTDLAMPPRVVARIDILVPPGPNGLVGFALAMADQPIIPYNAGEWIVSNDERITLPLDGFPDSGAWQLLAYNLGQYDHTLRFTFELHLTGAGPDAGAAVPLASSLSTVPDAAAAQAAADRAALDALLAQTDVSAVP